MIKKIILLIIIFSSLMFQTKAQIDTIAYRKTMMGYQYSHQGRLLTYYQLNRLVKTCVEARGEMRKANLLNIGSSSLGAAGGAVIGYILAGKIIDGTDIDYKILAYGGGLVIVSVPLYYSTQKRTLNAVKKYNLYCGINTYN